MQTSLDSADIYSRRLRDLFERQVLVLEQDQRLALQRRERRHRAGHGLRPLRCERILEWAAVGLALGRFVRFPIADAKPLERQIPPDPEQVPAHRPPTLPVTVV